MAAAQGARGAKRGAKRSARGKSAQARAIDTLVLAYGWTPAQAKAAVKKAAKEITSGGTASTNAARILHAVDKEARGMPKRPRAAKHGAKKSAKRGAKRSASHGVRVSAGSSLVSKFTVARDRGAGYKAVGKTPQGLKLEQIYLGREATKAEVIAAARKAWPNATAPKSASRRGAKKSAKPAASAPKTTWTLIIDRVGHGLLFQMIERDASGREVGEYTSYRGESRAAFLKRLRASRGFGKNAKYTTRRTRAAKAKTPATKAAKRTARRGPTLTAAQKQRRQAAWNRYQHQHAGQGISQKKLAAAFKQAHPIGATS